MRLVVASDQLARRGNGEHAVGRADHAAVFIGDQREAAGDQETVGPIELAARKRSNGTIARRIESIW